MTQRTAFCFIALGVLFGSTPRTWAAPITWAFEGIVRSASMGNSSALAGSLGVSVGAPVSGQVTYESTTPESAPGSGVYNGLIGFEVVIGSYAPELGASSLNTLLVSPRSRGNSFDAWIAQGIAEPDNLFPSGAVLWLSLLADAPGVITGPGLPNVPPALSLLRPFALGDWTTIGYGTGLTLCCGPEQGNEVDVQLTSLALVPESEGLALLGLASLAIALRRGHGR